MKTFQEKPEKCFTYHFTCIGKIQNNFRRRLALALTFPIFFIFNCLSVLPIVALTFLMNNIVLFDTLISRWKKPMEVKE